MSNFPNRCYAWGAIPRWMVRLCLLFACLMWVGSAQSRPVLASSTPQTLPFSQDWSNTGMITTDDDWSGVPGIVGYLGNGLTSSTGANPQTILTSATGDVNVDANQTSPNTYTAGAVAEFHLADPVVALQGSGTADAPFLLISIDTTDRSGILVSYKLRDIDGRSDDAIQPVALHYRVGNSDSFTNVPEAYVADASHGPSLATLVTPVAVTLPADANDQPLVQLRIMTANAADDDELIGIDDILITFNMPEIDIQGNGQSIADGDDTPSSQDHTDFGAAAVDGGSVARTFTIHNIGAASLTVDSVTIEGAHNGDFSVTTPPASEVTGSGSTTFVVTFDPSTTGTRTATVSIASNDGDETPYTFTIQGEGVVSLAPPILSQGPVVTQLCYQAADSTYPAQSTKGVCTITFTLINDSSSPVEVRYYRVNTVTNGNWILNATSSPAQAGAIVLAPQTVNADATFAPQFRMGLMSTARYTLRFSVFGYVETSGASAAEDDGAIVELGTFGVELTPNLPLNSTQIFLPALAR